MENMQNHVEIMGTRPGPGLRPSPGWGPVRVGAHMGPYVFLKKVTFRVQTAPFDKITTDFWRSRRRLLIPDLLKAKKMRRQIIIF